MTLLKEVVATVEVADQATGFLHQQGARSHVPLRQAHFPERIETTGGDIGQVQRGGTGAADARGLADQAAEHAQVVVQVVDVIGTEGKAGAQQGAFQAAAVGDADATTVQGGTAATAGGEFFLAYRIEDHGVFQAALVLAGDAHREVRDATDEVGGAIQRVDDPDVVGAFAFACQVAGFLTVEAVGGVGLAQDGENGLLGSAIDFGDEVIGAFFVDGDNVQALNRTENQFTGAAGRAQCDVQHGLHG